MGSSCARRAWRWSWRGGAGRGGGGGGGGPGAGGGPRWGAGWIAPEYGIRHEAPVVSIVADRAADATFTTLVVPLAHGEEPPALRVDAESDTTTVEVTGARFTDTICWSEAGTPLDLGPLRCSAAAGLIRRDGEGEARVRAVGVGGGPVWAGWDRDRGMRAGRGGELSGPPPRT